MMDRRETEDIAERAARMAVHQTFALLGVDVSQQDSINDLRYTLDHARKMRKLSEGVLRRAVLTVAGAGALGAAVVFADSIRSYFRGPS